MKFNVGGLDRILRIVIGLVLIALAATGTVGWWGWLGVIPLLTGVVRFCPLYSLIGINTCPLKAKGLVPGGFTRELPPRKLDEIQPFGGQFRRSGRL